MVFSSTQKGLNPNNVGRVKLSLIPMSNKVDAFQFICISQWNDFTREDIQIAHI
jgi:hypothetical protein